MDEDKLTVAMMYWGDWVERRIAYKYVENLVKALNEYLTIPFSVICFLDKTLPSIWGVEYRGIPKSIIKWSLNLPKFYLHCKDNGLQGKILYFDLDTVIAGNINDFANYEADGHIVGIKPFRPVNQNKGWLPGGVLAFTAGQWEFLFHKVASNPSKWAMRTNGGKERFVYSLVLENEMKRYWQDVLPGQLVSYKRHCRKKEVDEKGNLISIIPKNSRIIAFHGSPRPHALKGSDDLMFSLWSKNEDIIASTN